MAPQKHNGLRRSLLGEFITHLAHGTPEVAHSASVAQLTPVVSSKAPSVDTKRKEALVTSNGRGGYRTFRLGEQAAAAATAKEEMTDLLDGFIREQNASEVVGGDDLEGTISRAEVNERQVVSHGQRKSTAVRHVLKAELCVPDEKIFVHTHAHRHTRTHTRASL